MRLKHINATHNQLDRNVDMHVAFTNQSREVAEPPVHIILWHTSKACKAYMPCWQYIENTRRRGSAHPPPLRREIRSNRSDTNATVTSTVTVTVPVLMRQQSQHWC